MTSRDKIHHSRDTRYNATKCCKTAHSDILSDKNDVIKSTIQYIQDTYSGFKYNHAKCTRDLGYIIDKIDAEINGLF